MRGRAGRICRMIWFIALALMAALAIFVSIIPHEDTTLSYSSAESFSGGWIDDSTGSVLTAGGITVGSGKTVTISHALGTLKASSGLFFLNPELEIQVYADQEMKASLGCVSPLDIGTDSLSEWVTIPLDEADCGRTLHLTFTNHGRSRRLDLTTFMIGTPDELSSLVMSDDLAGTIEGGLIALIAVVLFIYSIILTVFGLRRYRLAILYLALLSLTAFAWNLVNSHIMQFVPISPSLRIQLSYFTFYLLPLFLILFFAQLFLIAGSRRQNLFLVRSAAVYGAAVCVILLLYALNLVHITMSVTVIHAVDVLTLVILPVMCIHEFRRTHASIMKWPLVAFVLLFAGSVLNLFSYYTTTRAYDFSAGFRHGMLAFLIVLCVTVVRASMKEFGDVLSVDKYKHMAYIDQVTGGNTRSYFFEHIKDASGNEAHWYLCVNFVSFKLYNQILGYDECDHLLSELYSETEHFLDQNEFMCNASDARFLLWLNGSSEEDLHERCLCLKAALPKCLLKHKTNLLMKVNFYACLVQPGEKERSAIQDRAMLAFRNPKALYWPDTDCWVYRDECLRNSLFEKELEADLEMGLAQNQFQVYLQPKCDPRTGKMLGAEALIRWLHPKYGLIPPDRYIGLFEKNGLISKIDLYSFRKMCEYLKGWADAGVTEPPVLSANISKASVSDLDFFDTYRAVVEETGVNTKYLQFELTESMSYDDMDLIKKLVHEIHSIGASCAMDDFGKSYSNLASLEEFDFDAVKMDAVIFRGYPEIGERNRFVTELIHFLKNTGMSVTAEGIEIKAQADALASVGCDLIQGYYYAKPLKFEDFEKFRTGKMQD